MDPSERPRRERAGIGNLGRMLALTLFAFTPAARRPTLFPAQHSHHHSQLAARGSRLATNRHLPGVVRLTTRDFLRGLLSWCGTAGKIDATPIAVSAGAGSVITYTMPTRRGIGGSPCRRTARSRGKNMSRDELMDALREYVDREHPGWDGASVTVSRGDGREPERLVISPARSPSDASLPAESPHLREHIAARCTHE